jgi:uncharacterized protein YndB with AHSA1/START domain
MGKNWEVPLEYELDATPEQVWDAIATGPGIDSWFMGVTEVEPGEGGSIRTDLGGFRQESRITAWEPNRHLAYRSVGGEGERFIAFEYLLEATGGGATVMRQVASGFLPGDDWEAEFEAMMSGGPLYTLTLRSYVEHFAGRHGVPVTAAHPHPDFDAAWTAILGDLGVATGYAAGDTVRLAPTGLPPIEGVIDIAVDGHLGVRSDDGLYRFFRGYFAPGVGHHVFDADADRGTLTAGWQSWLAGALSG